VSEVMLACKIYFSDRLCVQVGWVGQSNSTTLVLFFQWTKYKKSEADMEVFIDEKW